MAAVNDGKLAIASSPHSQQCNALNARGLPCKAWAMLGELYCRLHLMTPEEREQQAREGGKARVRNVHRRKAVVALQSGPRVPRDEHAEALQRLREADEKLRQLVREGRLSEDELPQYYPKL